MSYLFCRCLDLGFPPLCGGMAGASSGALNTAPDEDDAEGPASAEGRDSSFGGAAAELPSEDDGSFGIGGSWRFGESLAGVETTVTAAAATAVGCDDEAAGGDEAVAADPAADDGLLSTARKGVRSLARFFS